MSDHYRFEAAFSFSETNGEVFPGLDIELDDHLTPRYALGVFFNNYEAATTEKYGYIVSNPGLDFGGVCLVNTFQLLNRPRNNVCLFARTGWMQVSLRKDYHPGFFFISTRRKNGYDPYKVAADDFFEFAPGIQFSHVIAQKGTSFIGSIAWRQLAGESSFGNSSDFSGIEFSFGLCW
jgi:hypothetical protein